MSVSPAISPAMARRIELWPIDRLVPYARNPRTHSDEQVVQIAASIAEFGFTSPIPAVTRLLPETLQVQILLNPPD